MTDKEQALADLKTEVLRLITETNLGTSEVIHHAYKQIKRCEKLGATDPEINEAVRNALLQGIAVLFK